MVVLSEEKKEKSLRFLIPIQTLPEKAGRNGVYDGILQEFMNSGLKYAEVRDIGKKPQTVSIMLKIRKKKMQITNVDIEIRNKKVYLKRIDIEENNTHELGTKTHLLKILETRKTASSGIKPSIDVTTIGGAMVIKTRCPKCKALNAKDSRHCSECGFELYTNEREYSESIKSMERLEKELNWARK